MVDTQIDDLQKRFRALGEEMVEVVRETNEGVREVTPSIMHNLIRIFYEFLNRLLNIQGLSPTKNLSHELKRIDDRISEARQIVERTDTQIKETKDNKSRKLLDNKLKTTKEEFAYLEHVKEILDDDDNRKKLSDFQDNMLYLVYGGHTLTLDEFRDIGQNMTHLISVMTGSKKSVTLAAPVDVPVTDVQVKERGRFGRFMDRVAETVTKIFGKRSKKERIEGLPEEAEPEVHGVMAKFVGWLKGGKKESVPKVPEKDESPEDAITAAMKEVDKDVPLPDDSLEIPVPEKNGFFEMMKDKLSLDANPEELEADMIHLDGIKDEMEHLGEKELDTIPIIDEEIDYLHHKDEELKADIMKKLSADDLVVVVKSFVSKKREQGFSDSNIKKALKQKNWPVDIIKNGLNA